jgi:hypothetical protein
MDRHIISIKFAVALTAMTLILLLASSQCTYAAAPFPINAPADVDGDYGEWNIPSQPTNPSNGDFFTYMYLAHKPDFVVLGNVSIRYFNGVVYVLALANWTTPGLADAADAWVKIQSISGNVVDGADNDDGAPPDFQWISPNYDGLGHVRGYEASFNLGPGTYYIQIHLEVLYDGAGATAGSDKDWTQIIIPNGPVVPEPSIALSLVASVAAASGFMVYRRKTQKIP